MLGAVGAAVRLGAPEAQSEELVPGMAGWGLGWGPWLVALVGDVGGFTHWEGVRFHG